ncbi:hypothetical protein TpMuguga_03g02300 [Theileria parva strain Muguga]|uniref:uncharacterized protein n=1 Tax=Theileria parva strain Muguga TaxID=333668 RepID=UPI001C61B660|nr:uncharacterized protein TpMuguga_03g02300 [Theileria parva strain Muguga]KAF5153104.1 hypothetical protein TpMuguga_03g02300 [Theileria parva strain Muguga]
MKRRKTTVKSKVKKIRSRSVNKLYNSEEYTEKFDKVISLLYKVLCKASVGSDSAECLTLTEFCNGLNTLGFKVTKTELVEHLKPILYGKNYNLEITQNYGNGNLTNTYKPTLETSNSSKFDHNLINYEVIKTLFLNINLKLSKSNVIF